MMLRREKAALGVMVCLSIGLFLLTPLAQGGAPSTEVHIARYDVDWETVLNQTTVNYTWMNNSLTVYGDGTTHYYHQGPTFDPANVWDSGISPEPAPGESVNVASRDYGAAQGSDLKDLCNLVGGMSVGDVVMIKATDNFSKSFDYDDVYEPEQELGRMVIAWYNPNYGGYPPAYDTGMRLIFFANTTNSTGKYVFGNWDMHETLNESRWHYYQGYPSSSGLSVQNVNRIYIYSQPITFSRTLVPGWNLISLPLRTADMTRMYVIDGSLTDSYDALFKYNATTHRFEALDSAADELETGVGYFIHMTAADTWTYDGANTSMNVELSEGLNMIGSLNCTKDVSDALSSIEGDYSYVARWNVTSQQFETYNPAAPSFFNDFTTMERGEGYFISMKAAGTLTEACSP